jgi:WD40 repeat protein
MRSTNVTPQPDDDEDRPPPPFQWWSGGAVFVLGMLGFIGLTLGALLGGLLWKATGLALLAPVGLGCGVLVGLALGYRDLRRLIGRGQRISDEPLPPLRSAVSPSTHIQVLPDRITTAPARRDNVTAVPARRIERIVAHTGRVQCMAVSPDGKWLLTGGGDRAVRMFDLASGIGGQFTTFGSWVRAVAFSPDGRLAAACGHDRSVMSADCSGSVLVWDVELGRELRRFDAKGLLLALAFTPVGRRLLIGGTDYLRVWDLETAELLALLNLEAGVMNGEAVLSLAASPDGRFALCGCRNQEGARLIDLERGDCVRRFTGGRCAWLFVLRPVAFSPDGLRVIAGSQDQTARIWDVETGKQLACFSGHRGRWGWGWRGVVAVAFLPDGRRALSASEDGTVRLWEASTGREIERFDHGARVCSLAATRDGRRALSGGKDGVVRVWELPPS